MHENFDLAKESIIKLHTSSARKKSQLSNKLPGQLLNIVMMLQNMYDRGNKGSVIRIRGYLLKVLHRLPDWRDLHGRQLHGNFL